MAHCGTIETDGRVLNSLGAFESRRVNPVGEPASGIKHHQNGVQCRVGPFFNASVVSVLGNTTQFSVDSSKLSDFESNELAM